VLALLADAAPMGPGASTKGFDLKQDAVRLLRGAIESVARALGGEHATIELIASTLPMAGFDPGASAEVRLVTGAGVGGAGAARNERIGMLGLVASNVVKQHDLQTPVVAAEVNVGALLALFPPRSLVQTLPEFPGIERDLSFVVGESTAWSSIDQLVRSSNIDLLVGHEFVTTFRGAQLGAGKKSVTVRLAFRDPKRTLRHEEVDPQVATLVKLAQDKLGATLRA